jgi:hypothetical protein
MAEKKETKNMVTNPSVDAELYLEDSVDATPKHGTTVQAGWGAADAFLNKPKASESKFATNFKFSESPTLVRFLSDAPFHVYEEHWVDRTEGRRSFVCLGEDCPLCTIAGDKPRAKFSFNVLVLSDEEPNVQVLTTPPTLARQLRAANDDPRRGPLSKYFWALSRLGTGRDTQYTVERVRATDLAEEWELDPATIDAAVAAAVPYDKSTIYVSPREELIELARTMVS